MTDQRYVAATSVHVAIAPERAFEIFTADIGSWWKCGTMYWNDRDRGLRYEFEPRVGGRLLEIYEDGLFEVGTVEAWDPGRLLVFTWRQEDWTSDGATTVSIRFVPDDTGTTLELEHSGWETVAGGEGMAAGYWRGWDEILGWYSTAAV